MQKNKGGRPRSARPAVRSAISMRAEDADLIHSTLVHAIETGVIEKPPSRLNGQPFAGVLPLLVKFCREYIETHNLEIVEYDPSKNGVGSRESVGMTEMSKANMKDRNCQTRSDRLELRTTAEETALFKRCATHFAADGMTEPEVSDFVRKLVILYAVEHGIPLFDGDGGMGIEEVLDDPFLLERKKVKISEGLKRLRARR